LLKIVLYSNISSALIDGEHYNPVSVIGLTANDFKGVMSGFNKSVINNNFKKNSSKYILLKKLFKEANDNSFKVFVSNCHDLSEAKEKEIIQ
jgi:hypothetical protein